MEAGLVAADGAVGHVQGAKIVVDAASAAPNAGSYVVADRAVGQAQHASRVVVDAAPAVGRCVVADHNVGQGQGARVVDTAAVVAGIAILNGHTGDGNGAGCYVEDTGGRVSRRGSYLDDSVTRPSAGQGQVYVDDQLGALGEGVGPDWDGYRVTGVSVGYRLSQ